MTVADTPVAFANAQHLLLEDVSWELYDHMCREFAERQIRMTYDNGRLEIMSPLPKHERWGAWIGRLVELMCADLQIHIEPLGSTTFRSHLKKMGLEPDECYYVQHAADVGDLEDEFDSLVHPAPDLAIEIDITSRSVAREPIYAALGVSELWRFDGTDFRVLHLTDAKYIEQPKSLAFPCLPVSAFTKFVLRRRDKNQLGVVAEFREWVKGLSR